MRTGTIGAMRASSRVVAAPAVVATVLAGGLTPAVAAAPVAPALRAVAAKLHARTTLPVLLPSVLPIVRVAGKPLYSSVSTTGRSWSVELGLAPGCNGANACSAGFLGAVRSAHGPTAADGRRVTLHRGVTGRYRALSCGASCSPPSITFRTAGVTVTYQLKLDLRRGDTDRAALVRVANSALDAGPR